MKKASGYCVLLVGLVLCSVGGVGQVESSQGYFSYPLRIKPKLNANFGEMRPNHFHMGLDLSTEAKENLPVYAPADGYVARMKIETGGFGRAIYLNHPNGMTTLYAHMNRFIPAAEMYLKQQQYARQTWKIDVNLPDGALPVRKGQLIGFSGNTGASQGPHVHFEVRDTETENCLNPLSLGFGLDDQTPPDLLRLAFYDRSKSVYAQQPRVFSLVKKGINYVVPEVINLPFEKVFVAIEAVDRMTGFPNQNGIYQAQLLEQETVLSSFLMDNISYDDTRYLNGHIDYRVKARGGPYYQMLFPPKSFGLGLYTTPGQLNHIGLLDKQPKALTIRVMDAHGNVSTVDFELQKNGNPAPPPKQDGALMVAGQLNIYEDNNIQFVFGEQAFYDDFHFLLTAVYANAATQLSSVYQVLPTHVPVHQPFTVRIKPNRNLALVRADRVVVKRQANTKIEIKKAGLERGSFAVQFRDLGFFQLLQDLEPPKISSTLQQGAVLRQGSTIVVEAADNNHVIKEFRATASGQWLMFQPSGSRFVYLVDEHLPIGEHILTVVVYDEAGNSTVKEWQIVRK